MNLPIRAAHAREAWLAIYMKWIDAGQDVQGAQECADLGLCDYVARFGDADLQEDLENCIALREAME